MVDVRSKKCEFPGCNTFPSFNFENELKTIYCKIHKKNGMINKRIKKLKR